MPTIKIGNFSKRKNSTSIPDVTNWTEITFTYKNPTSLKSPILELATNDATFTYAYIPDFARYYFVTDAIRLHNNLTEYHFECDSMASQKAKIGSTVARIAFASTGFDKYIPDSRLGVKASINTFTQSANSGLGNGKNILTVANDNDGIAFYGMNDTNVGRLITCLMSQNVGDQIRKMMNDPMQAIFSCVWVPYFPTNLNSVNVRIADKLLDGSFGVPAVVGDWIPASGKIVTLSTVSLTIPFKYQDFRDLQPYTQMQLFLPGVGCVDLNPNDFVVSNTVNIITTCDITTGDIIYRILNDEIEVVQTVSISGGVPVPISGTSSNMKGSIASIGGMVGAAAGIAASVASGGSAAPAAGALIISGASAALNANMTNTSLKGTNGSRSDFTDLMFTLLVTVKDTEDPDATNYISHKGRPVCQTNAISTHSGFIQCDGASVIGDMQDWEREEINGFLNSGFYYI